MFQQGYSDQLFRDFYRNDLHLAPGPALRMTNHIDWRDDSLVWDFSDWSTSSNCISVNQVQASREQE